LDSFSVEVFVGCSIRVDLTAECDGSDDLLLHGGIIRVVWNVDLEEARVGVGQRIVAQVRLDGQRVLIADILEVEREARPSPGELEIHLSLLVVEGSEDSPEHFDYLAVLRGAVVAGD